MKKTDRTDRGSDSIKQQDGIIDKDQRLSEGRVEAEDGKLDFEESSDDEEIALLLPRKGADAREPPGADIRDVPEASGTQREDWFHMEPLHGARPKWNQAGQPPVVPEEPRGLEAEATGNMAGQDVGSAELRLHRCHCLGRTCRRRKYSTNHVYLHRFSRLRFCVCV